MVLPQTQMLQFMEPTRQIPSFQNMDFVLNGVSAKSLSHNTTSMSTRRNPLKDVNFFKAEKQLYANTKSALDHQFKNTQKSNLPSYMNSNNTSLGKQQTAMPTMSNASAQVELPF